MSTESLRIDSSLARQAGIIAKIENRSKAKQIEYWAKIGRIIAPKLNIADVFAVSQGIKTIKLEMSRNSPTLAVDPDNVFDDLEAGRANGSLAKQVTSLAPFYFEKSISQPGYLDRVDTLTGERVTGRFENGEFTTL